MHSLLATRPPLFRGIYMLGLIQALSILSPISVHAKLLMQRLWKQRIMWDEPLDPDILEEWTAILIDINKISFIRAFFQTFHQTPHCGYMCLQMPAQRHIVRWPIYLT